MFLYLLPEHSNFPEAIVLRLFLKSEMNIKIKSQPIARAASKSGGLRNGPALAKNTGRKVIGDHSDL